MHPNDVDDVNRNPVDKSLFKFLLLSWNWFTLSQVTIEMIQEMVFGIHVRKTRWPGQDVDVDVVQVLWDNYSDGRSYVVVLQ